MRLALLAGSTLAAAALASPPTFTIQPYGFRDPEHIYYGNYVQYTDLVSPSGALAGRTYLSNEIGGGVDAFLFTDGVMRNINLADAEHTDAGGGRAAYVRAINTRGDVVGRSLRFSGSAQIGESAWVRADGVTRRLGFIDGEYTRDDGSRYSYASGINDQGLVTGASQRYLQHLDAGYAVWMDDHGALTRLGFFDAAHTSSLGYQDSRVSAPDPQSRCVGWSARYPQGSDAWIYDDGVYTPVGLDDAEHTSPAGVSKNEASRINARGDVVGVAARWVDGIGAGRTVWIRSPQGVMHRLGLTDEEHTMFGTNRDSAVLALTENGFAAGTSAQYTTSTSGRSVWVWDGAAVTRAGLTGPEFTDTTGLRRSEITLVGPTGVVAGQSSMLGIPAGGQGAWIHAGGRTVQLGLADAAHTGSRGQRYSRVTAVNAAGDAVGFSQRFDADQNRATGWFYNHADGSLTPLIFSTRDDGVDNSYPTAVTDDGAVIGGYTDYRTSTPRGVAFWWSAAEGRYDLAELVEGGLAQSGFTDLTGASSCTTLASGAALITASGPVSTPEPAVHALLTSTGRTLCLADFNRDAFVDFFDYADFVAAFESGDPRADFNRDGFADFFDYLAFAQAFEAGC